MPSSILSISGHRLDLHTFPTRRSSDLDPAIGQRISASTFGKSIENSQGGPSFRGPPNTGRSHLFLVGLEDSSRSEEHTSELQSHHDLVCRLLLAKNNTLPLLPFYTFRP